MHANFTPADQSIILKKIKCMMNTSKTDFAVPLLPSPQLKVPNSYAKLTAPHFSTPSGMVLPREQQPPPMFGLRGSTIPAKFLNNQKNPYDVAITTASNSKRLPSRPNPTIYCDSCDRAFYNHGQFEKHQRQKHAEALGIQTRVYTPEEIEEWRAERRKRYPTAKNVELRRQAQEEREKRGERIEIPKTRFGNVKKTHQHRMGRQHGLNHNFKPKKTKRKWADTCKTEKHNIVAEDDQELVNNGLIMFKGTAQLEDYKKGVVIHKSNALSSLFTSYNSESEEETSAAEGNNSGQAIHIQLEEGEIESDSENGQIELDNEDPPVELKFERKDDTALPCISRTRKRQKKNNDDQSSKISRTTTTLSNRCRRYQNTLLEKLLEPEIRHERNVLLQCVRFVVENKFFGIGAENH